MLALLALVVTIDAHVADARGRPIETLKASDFEVREDGTPQALDEVRFVREPSRLFAIYLDEYHVSPGAAAERVRQALLDFLDHAVGPDDLVAVMKPLDSLFKIQLTHDRTAARALVAAFQGREGEYAPRNDYERELIAGTPERVEAARTQIVWSGINALAVHLGSSAARRKTLIVASESLAREPRRRGHETLPTIETAIRSANRSNVAVYALDPSDAAAAGDDDPLHRIAEETDGRVIVGDLAAGLRRVDAESRAYYLLTYQTSHPDDGRFHAVEVRVKRSGAAVSARKGFFDASPDEAIRAAVLARLNAPRPTKPPEPAPHASPLIRPWFGWSRGTDGSTRVTFVWEPVPRVPGDRTKKIAAKLMFTALANDGAVLFEGPVAPTGAGTIDEPGAIPSRAVFDAPPGRIKLRMAIQDAAGQPLDRDVRDIVVRDLKGDLALGTPEIVRARNAREVRELGAQAAVPVVARDFSRAEELIVRVPVYGADGASPSVSARLLSRAGQAMRDLRIAAAPDGVDQFLVPLAGLALGDYTIEVKATSGKGEASDRVNFRVTP